MENIFQQLFANFDLSYIFAINALTYFIIKLIDSYNESTSISTFYKRLILIGVCCIMFPIYYCIWNKELIILVNSTIAAPVVWSWIIRPIFKHLNLGYAESNTIKTQK